MRITCFLSLLFITCSFAQRQAIVIEKAEYAVDTLSRWKANQLPDKAFRPISVQRPLVTLGYNENTAVWCRVTLRNTDVRSARSTWFCLDNNHLDSIILYRNGRMQLLGDRTDRVSPFIVTQAFAISLRPGETRTLTVRVKKVLSFLEFPLSVHDGNELRRETSIKVAVTSFLLGIILLLMIFNGILFGISRDRTYSYYICYSVLSAVYIAISSYYAKYVVFGDFLYFSEMRVYTASVWLMCLVAFLSHYIEMRTLQPRMYRFIRVVMLINSLVIVVTLSLLLLGNHNLLQAGFIFGYFLFFIAIVATIWGAVASIRKRPAAGLYVLMAFLPHFAWGLWIIFKFFGLVSRDMGDDVLVYVCLYEVLLFGYVLARNYVQTFRRNRQLMLDIIHEKENTLQATTQAQIRERRNVANILHDNLGSRIAYILKLIELERHEEAHESMSGLATEIRDISHKILPKSLDDGAFVASLQAQADSWNRILSALVIELYTFDFPERIVEPWIFDLYLVAIEIITNALKHGRAEQIVIELYAYEDTYVFQFTDNGMGFDTKTTNPGFGLANIASRIQLYGGTFEINSPDEGGTIVQVQLPRDR